MVLKLDPRLPLVWRSPTSVQLGVDPPIARVDEVTTTQERLLAALLVGVTEPGLSMIAGRHDEQRRALLDAVRPALLVPDTAADQPIVAISGRQPLLGAIWRILDASGVRLTQAPESEPPPEDRPHLAVLVGDFVLAPARHAYWLRRDVPHLPVLLGESSATVGPVVEPGLGPCLRCLDLHRRDEDAAWPAIATQLLGREVAAEPATLVAETSAAAARAVIGRLAEGPGAAHSLRIDAVSGQRHWRLWQEHPECGCCGIPPRDEAALSSAR